MRAVVQHDVRDIRVEEWPDPRPEPGEVLVRIASVTICASDIHIYAEGDVGGVRWDEPFVPGHEVAGVVEDSNGTDLPVGTRVVFDPARPCGSCDLCQDRMSHLCRNLQFLDLPPVHGGMRGLVAWPPDCLFPVPESVDLVEAPLIEPLAVGVHAVELAAEVSGASVAIAGCGAIGLCTLQIARLHGAGKVIVTDPIEERLAVARELGADVTVQVGPQDPVEEILRATDGRGAEIVVEAAGPPEAVEQCLKAVRPGGEALMIGIPAEETYPIAPSLLRRKEISLRFVRRQNENYPETIELVSEARVQLGPMLTHRFPVERAREAFDLAERKADGAVRVAVTF